MDGGCQCHQIEVDQCFDSKPIKHLLLNDAFYGKLQITTDKFYGKKIWTVVIQTLTPT